MSHLMLLFVLNVVAVSVDCPRLISLAQGLNMDRTTFTGDCCTQNWEGIICDSLRVTEIDWNGKGLAGYFNSSALPISLTSLKLGSNSITGALPDFSKSPFPSLTFLDLSSNRFNGTIPALSPLVAATWIDLSSNLLTGCIPSFSNLTNLESLYLIENQLTGPIPGPLPPNLLDLEVHGNQLSGYFPSGPNALNKLFLQFATFTGNHISGTITVSKVSMLMIESQNIWDIEYTELAILATKCTIGGNPLLGNPRINSLVAGNCANSGIYAYSTALSRPYSFQCLASSTNTFPTTLVLTTTIRPTSSVSNSGPATVTSNNNPTTITAAPSVKPTTTIQSISTMTSSVSTSQVTPFLLVSNNLLTTDLLTETATASMLSPDENKTKLPEGTMTLVIIAGAAFLGVCVLILIAGKVFKNPKIHSKFARKSSYDTLQTMQSKNK